MNTHNAVLDNAPAEATTSDRILQIALAAWKQGNFVEVADQFNDQFTFTDHALGLEFKNKGRLTEFLAKISEHFPDSERRDNTFFSSGDHVISEWTLTATRTEPCLGGRSGKGSNLRARHICRADKEWEDQPVVRLLRPTEIPAQLRSELFHRLD
jgi:hypothetical protein